MISHAVCSLLSSYETNLPSSQQEGHCPARISLLRRTSHALGVGPVCHSSSLSQGVVLCWDARAKRGTPRPRLFPCSSHHLPKKGLTQAYFWDISNWQKGLAGDCPCFRTRLLPLPSSHNQQPQTEAEKHFLLLPQHDNPCYLERTTKPPQLLKITCSYPWPRILTL